MNNNDDDDTFIIYVHSQWRDIGLTLGRTLSERGLF